ncbi:winged helix-turn-helix transcriptional regulator [Haladaptatus paucihalophilus]|uniref:Helix-turn-helix domain-containing protein n=1 Tax=Haladaptatus paucihalophilus DX253 TaxID=797209 RepID=A0A1M6YY29_HALPU|nr:helix-turn-helix domain-containing protein [Haladaptatus paucihalophilus]SHL23201.1 Helix-turn-helix domain-containing protein [Haladaptatus paucihalophilus DX253]
MNSSRHRTVVVLTALLLVATVPLGFVVSASAGEPMHHATPAQPESNAPTLDSPVPVGPYGRPTSQSVFAAAEYADIDEAPGSTTVRSYSRYDGSNPLENSTRAKIYDAIADEPGLSLSALSERTEIPRSTVRYHVRILQEEGLVETTTVRGKRRVHPAGDENPELAASLSDDSTATLLETVARDGPASVSDLADALDRTPGTVSYHLERLADDGLVERERAGNAVVTTLADDVAAAMDTGNAIDAD